MDFEASLYCKLVNAAYDLAEGKRLTAKKLNEVAYSTERLVKQTEAYFRLLDASVPNFDHFTPARHLLENPTLLDSDSKEVEASLNKFGVAFEKINAHQEVGRESC